MKKAIHINISRWENNQFILYRNTFQFKFFIDFRLCYTLQHKLRMKRLK